MRTSTALHRMILLLAGLAIPAGAMERYVAPGGANTGEGTNPAAPWATLTHAVSQAISNDTIHVGAGTYTEGEIHVRKGLTLRGAGADRTIVQAAATPGAATNRVLQVHTGIPCTIADMTIRHGRTLDAENAGGIRNSGMLTLTGVTVRSNMAAGAGGGIRSSAATLTLESCRVENNTAARNGGGIEIYLGSLTVSHSTLLDNHASYNGGGFYNNGGAGAFNCSTIISNSATTNGGGMAFVSTVSVSNCTVGYNTAGLSGGGLYNNGATGGVWNSSIIGNQAEGGSMEGGGGIANGGPLWLINCTLSLNGARQEGGGIRNNITNMTLWLRNCTITGNGATNSGGGIHSTMGELVMIKNTIVGANRAAASPDAYGVFGSEDFNLIQNTAGATLYGITTNNKYGLDPGLATLQDNGGPTLTHALAAGSPALNAGDPAFAAPPATDQRGAPRIQGGRIDIGAYERLEADQDGDGMDGQWEFAHGLNPTNAADATQNPDGDACRNLAEYTADTDPQANDSFWRLESIAVAGPATIGFLSSPARQYDLEWAATLATNLWSGVAGRTNVPGNGQTFTLTDPTVATQRHYRVRVHVP
jgi:hypothetical protein